MSEVKIIEKNDLELENACRICTEYFFNNGKYRSAENVITEVISDYIKNKDAFRHYYPQSLVWGITSDCNLRCKHCYFHDEKFDSSNDLSTNQVMSIIDEIVQMNIVNVTLTGGEALVRKDIFDILSKLKENNISVRLSTNATLITKEIAKKLSLILNPVIDDIQVSFDGATKETHDKTRGKGSFEKAVCGVKNLVECGIQPLINATTSIYNIQELPEIYNLAKSLNAKAISISRILPCDEEQETLVPDTNLLFKKAAEVIKLAKSEKGPILELKTFIFYDFMKHSITKKYLKKHVEASHFKTKGQNFMCHNHNKIDINSQGKVYLCFFAANNDICSLGDLKKESLMQIWVKRHENDLFQERNLDSATCKKCDYVSFCKGGCPLNAYQKYGSINAPDTNCPCGDFIRI